MGLSWFILYRTAAIYFIDNVYVGLVGFDEVWDNFPKFTFKPAIK